MHFLLSVVLTCMLGVSQAKFHSRAHPKLDINIDEVKKMILEYNPEIREVATSVSHKAEDLSLRMLQHGIDEAKARAAANDNIPALAGKLNLTALVDAVVKADLKETLEGKGPFTVFGPTNEAFNALPSWAKSAIANVTILTDILKYHVLAAEVESSSLKNDLLATTVEGKQIRINTYGSAATNNQVFTAQCAPIDLSRVDQKASNGLIHVLNKVMLPPSGTIVGAVAACPAFKTLVKAVTVASLVDTLNGAGPFTLFAPTDDAFAKLPPGVVDKLIKNPKELAKILTYHVVSGTFCSAGLSSGPVKTVEGQTVKVVVSSGAVEVNGAKVISADGSVTNGVVHAIDTVLLPPTFKLP